MAVPPPDLKLDFKSFIQQMDDYCLKDVKFGVDFGSAEKSSTLKWSTDKFKWPDTYTVSIPKPTTFNFDDIDLALSQAELDRQKRVDDLLRKRLQQAMFVGSQQFLKTSMSLTWDDHPCREVTLNEALKKKNRLDEVKAVKAICDLLAKALI